MPKSAFIPEDPTEGAVVHSVVNGIDEVLLKSYVNSIEAEEVKIEEIMADARARCQVFVDEIKAIKKKAAENGIAKKPFNAKLNERKFLRKADHVSDALSDDQKDVFEEISLKLGDLPLFQSVSE